MHKTEYNGISFYEGSIDGCQTIRHCKVTITGFFSQSQLKSLTDVKKNMAIQVKKAGGNAIINFKYGQKSNFWAIFGIDDISWYGEGDIIVDK